MQRDPRAFLWDVREASVAIQTFTRGMSLEAFVTNAMAQSAVERKFEVIGEALNQLSKLDSSLATRIPDLPRIVAFRNQLIHGYAMVSTETVWNVAQTSVAPLLQTVQELIEELDSV